MVVAVACVLRARRAAGCRGDARRTPHARARPVDRRRVPGPARRHAGGPARRAATAPRQACSSSSRSVVFGSVPFDVPRSACCAPASARAGAVSELARAARRAAARPSTCATCSPTRWATRSLELAYWLARRLRYVDAHGTPVELPQPRPPPRAATPIDRDGKLRRRDHPRRLAQRAEPDLVRTRSAAAAGARAARTSGSTPSCARASPSCDARAPGWSRPASPSAAASSATCTTAPSSGSSRCRCRSGWRARQVAHRPRAGATSCSRAPPRSFTQALAELRELARGIHPAVLVRSRPRRSPRGAHRPLAAAGRRRSTCRSERLPARRRGRRLLRDRRGAHERRQVRRGAARPRSAVAARQRPRGDRGRRRRRRRRRPGRGSGLRGLADRVAALDGTLELDSPPGSGTTLRAEIPV